MKSFYKSGSLVIIAVFMMGAEVSARVVSVSEYNAVPNDGIGDQYAFSAAFSTVIAAGGGEILVPPGDYQFDSRITVDLASSS